jgi:hypothetical protein
MDRTKLCNQSKFVLCPRDLEGIRTIWEKFHKEGWCLCLFTTNLSRSLIMILWIRLNLRLWHPLIDFQSNSVQLQIEPRKCVADANVDQKIVSNIVFTTRHLVTLSRDFSRYFIAVEASIMFFKTCTDKKSNIDYPQTRPLERIRVETKSRGFRPWWLTP